MRNKTKALIERAVSAFATLVAAVASIRFERREIVLRKRVEEQLRESEAQRATILDAALDCIIMMDHEGRITEFNPAAERTFGYSREEALGRELADTIIPPPFREAHRRGLAHCLATGEGSVLGRRIEVTAMRSDGAEFPAELAIVPGGGGEQKRFTGYLRDITERERAEEDLRESERQFRQLFEHSVDALMVHDGEGRIVDCNAETCRSLGYSREEMLGLRVSDFATDLVPEERRDESDTLWRRAERGEPGEVSGVHMGEHRRKDGTRFPVEVRVSPIDYKGESMIFASARDITERKEAEKELSREREFLAAVLEHLRDGIVACDAEGKLTLFNQSTREFHGVDEERLGPDRWSEHYDLYYPDGRTPMRKEDIPLLRALCGENVREAEMVIAPKGGPARTLLASGQAFYDAEGNKLGAVVAMHDVTERKGAEEQILRQSRSLADFSSNLKQLHRISTANYETLDELFADYLRAGCEILGLGTGIVSRIEGDTFTIRAVRSDLDLAPGTQLDLSDTYCDEAISTKRTAHCNHVGEDAELSCHPAYRNLKLESFISTPVWLDGEAYGTLHFSSTQPRAPFGDHEREVVEMIAQSIGRFIAMHEAEEGLREAEDRYRTLVEQIPAVTYIETADGSGSEYTSPQIEALLGYTPEEWLANHVWENNIHPDDRERVLSADELSRAMGQPFSYEYRVIAKDGREVWVRDEGRLLRDEAGKPLAWQGFLLDISEQKEAEKALTEAENRYRTLIEQMPAVTYTNPMKGSGSSIYMSPQIQELVGYSVEDSRKDPGLWDRLLHPEDRERVIVEEARARRNSEPIEMEYRMIARDGSVVWVRNEAVLVHDEHDEPLYWQGIMLDITERRRLEARLSHQAFHDALTGLPNRALFKDRLEHALSRTERLEDSVAILFLDLDNFKFVNDTLGHEAGDELLRLAAQVLQECVRASDTIARLGGDEFAVLLEGVGKTSDAVRTAERILEKLQFPFVLESREFFLNTSVGISSSSSGESGEELIRKADMAMYEAKKHGKARYRVFDLEMESVNRSRLELETALRRALERAELRLHYQPEVALEDGKIVGFEALLRWEHPTFGMVSPADFIPLAEETGLIIPISRWVLKEACRQAKEWQDRHDHKRIISVNLSARQFQSPGLVRDVRAALAEAALEPEDLVLEITESIALNDVPSTTATLKELWELGVGLAIDDFGTGYSSLSYLRRLNANYLKMDRSFIEKLGSDPDDTVLVSGVINLAQSLGLKVIAEGVEEVEQIRWLRDLGCDLAQGHYFQKPLAGYQVGEFLRTFTMTSTSRQAP